MGELPLDPDRLFPVIVPTGYFPTAPPARVPFLEGLDLVFGEGGGGAVGYVPDARFESLGLTTRDAERIALENLSRHVRRGDVDGRAIDGADGKPAFMLWGGGHWLAASSLLMPGLRSVAQYVLGEPEVCAAIPHRGMMLLFGIRDQAWRDRMQRMITENESGGPKPITRRLIRLLDTGDAPYYEQPSFAYLD